MTLAEVHPKKIEMNCDTPADKDTTLVSAVTQASSRYSTVKVHKKDARNPTKP